MFSRLQKSETCISLHLESNKKDPFRAQVQWYSRVEQLPKRLRFEAADPPLDEAWEVVHEGQRYKGDLSIETVFGKCNILWCDVSDLPKSDIGKQKKSWVFFCRFALGNDIHHSIINLICDIYFAIFKDPRIHVILYQSWILGSMRTSL